MNRILTAAITTCAALGLATVTSAQTSPTSANTALEQELGAKERAMVQAVANGDAKTFAEHVAPTTISLGPTGITTASELEQRLPQMKVADLKITDLHVMQLTPDVAVVYYHVSGTPMMNGKPMSMAQMMGGKEPSAATHHGQSTSAMNHGREMMGHGQWQSTIWSKADGTWKPVFHQNTPTFPASEMMQTRSGR